MNLFAEELLVPLAREVQRAEEQINRISRALARSKAAAPPTAHCPKCGAPLLDEEEAPTTP